MPGQNIIDEPTRNRIYSLVNLTLTEAQKFLTEFRTSAIYSSLISTDLINLSDEDIICLALTRQAEDTTKIDITLLRNAIFHVYLQNQDQQLNEDEYAELLENFDLVCLVIGQTKKTNLTLIGLQTAILI